MDAVDADHRASRPVGCAQVTGCVEGELNALPRQLGEAKGTAQAVLRSNIGQLYPGAGEQHRRIAATLVDPVHGGGIEDQSAFTQHPAAEFTSHS